MVITLNIHKVYYLIYYKQIRGNYVIEERKIQLFTQYPMPVNVLMSISLVLIN